MEDSSKKSGNELSESQKDQEEEEDEDRYQNDFEVLEDSEEDEEESKSVNKLNEDDSQMMQLQDQGYGSDNQSSRLSRTPTTAKKIRKGKV